MSNLVFLHLVLIGGLEMSAHRLLLHRVAVRCVVHGTVGYRDDFEVFKCISICCREIKLGRHVGGHCQLFIRRQLRTHVTKHCLLSF